MSMVNCPSEVRRREEKRKGRERREKGKYKREKG
jgi:hypothetical protein